MSISDHSLVSVEELFEVELRRCPPRYDNSFRQLVADLIQQGLSAQEIASDLFISDRTVQRYRKNLEGFGTHAPAPCGLTGRPRKMTTVIEEGMLEYLNNQPQGPYLDEIQLFLLDTYGVDIHTSNICRSLARMKWTRKKAVRVHPDRNDEDRARFRSSITTYTANQLVVVDESGCNSRTGDRQWGFAPNGLVYRMIQTRKRSNNWSVLPALGINGVLEYEIYPGSFNTERFINFIRRLVLKMTPYPGPRSVLILDNCSTHHDAEIREITEEQGIIIEYLPSYSPDFSPIEPTFSVLKSWIRRNRSLLKDPGVVVDFAGFLHLAVLMSDLKYKARELFIKCHYTVNDDDHDIDYEEL